MWVLLILFVISGSSYGEESNSIQLGGFSCPREDAALGHCLKDVLNSYIPQLATGLPEYDVPPCEPLLIPSLTVQQTTGPIIVTSSYNDVLVKGPSKMRIKEIEVDSKNNQFVGRLYIPELKLTGHYNLVGHLLMLPIEGEGQFSGKYGDIEAIVTITLGRLPRDNGVDALKCENLDVEFRMGYASMQLDNLFGGDGELGKATNKFLNENWQRMADELQIPLQDALKDFLKPLADHAFATLDADDILSS